MKSPYQDEIKNFTKEDFENNRVNLHIHTTFSDGKANAFDIIRQAKEKGYKKLQFVTTIHLKLTNKFEMESLFQL